LAASLSGQSQSLVLAEAATRFLAITALVDGILDQAKIKLVLEYADVLADPAIPGADALALNLTKLVYPGKFK